MDALDKAGLLFRVNRPMAKESQVTPLARLQYRGLPENKRRGFLFENVTDAKGRRYNTRLATGIYASSIQIYALALGCEPTRESIQERWTRAQLNPIKTELVGSAPVQQEVCAGDDLLVDGNGLESLPIPVEVPGYSGSIRTTTQIITKDPETGVQNVGNYSGHMAGKKTIHWGIAPSNHGYLHWKAWGRLGKPMPIAIVTGGPPSFFFVGGTKIPYGVDELTIAGALNNQAIQVVRAKTVDLNVPAHAEIVIEGLVHHEYQVLGGSFGEYNGYMAIEDWKPFIEVTAVTTRKDPIYVHVMSQFPPSESSVIRRISAENVYHKFLKYDCKLPGIIDVTWHEMSQSKWCVVKIKKVNNAHPWQVLECVSGYDAYWGKYFIVVDEDIDIRDFDSVGWALCWRVQPDRDTRVIKGRIPQLDHSAFDPNASREEKNSVLTVGSSAMLIDATRKFPYPPTSLPRREFMDEALKSWKELGFPELQLKQPWYGYELGNWPDEFRQDAELVLKGEHYKVAERFERMKERVGNQ